MLLYEHPGSPYAQKTKIALREKSVAFDVELPKTLGTGQVDEAFGMANMRTNNYTTNLTGRQPSGQVCID